MNVKIPSVGADRVRDCIRLAAIVDAVRSYRCIDYD